MRQNSLPEPRQHAADPRAAQAREPAPARQSDDAVLEAACAIDQTALWSTRRIRGFIVTQRPLAQRGR